MFWGLIVEPNKRYTQVVEKAFHISMACLDTEGDRGDGSAQVMLCYENFKYILCNLNHKHCLQCPLDLNFDVGSKITFALNGSSTVHLTGYHIEDNVFEDEVVEEEEIPDEEEEPVLEQDSKKRKNEKTDNKASKRPKTEMKEETQSNDLLDDSDTDDEDFEINESAEDEEDSSDDLDEEEDDDSMDEEMDDEEEEVEVEKVEEKPVEKKEEKKTKKSKKQKREEKQMMNGSADSTKAAKKLTKEKENGSPKAPKRTLEGGVQVEDFKIGTGPVCKRGKMVSVYYVGRVKDGKKFDSLTTGTPMRFKLGSKEVISGWDIGIAGMKVGGKRRMIIPPGQGYGAKGYPPVIPPNSTLIFDIELKKVH